MLFCNVHVQVGLFVEGLAAGATGPQVDPILKLAKLLSIEHI